MLHQAVGDQLVIFGRLQVFGESLERHEEAEKILVLIKRLGFGNRAFFAVPAAEFDQSLRRDRAFEMEVEFGFGKCADEAGRHEL